MRINVLVTEETLREGKSQKTGQDYKMVEITMHDVSEGVRCRTPLRMTLADKDMEFQGKLRDQRIMVDVHELKPGFGGSVDVRGSIVREVHAVRKPGEQKAA